MGNFHIDKSTYATDPRFQALRDAGISYEDFSFNQSYYLNTLSKSSIMDLYKKGQAMYEKYTDLYNNQNNIFIKMKADARIKENKYNDLLTAYAKNSQTGEATSHDKTVAALYSGFTSELQNNLTDAEIMKDIYLSQRFNAVDMQRRGLMG